MPTEERQRINSVKRLHEIRKEVFSSDFDSLSKQELSSLRSELKRVYLETGGTQYAGIFEECDSRVTGKLDALKATVRFRIQIAFSVAILAIALWNLVQRYV
jgi:hypothetical protein